MPKLVFDIETVGEDFVNLDHSTQEVLTRWIKNTAEDEDKYEGALRNLKNNLGFSPLTGQIVAIGILDGDQEKGAVYFQSPGVTIPEFEEGNVKLVSMSERDMLEKFWDIAKSYDQFISFNGRSFDAPFLAVRSAVHKIRPSKDLLANRYLSMQRNGVQHIDLLDQLSFYGAMQRKGSLHLWCRAFGIRSPKCDGVTGDDVAKLFFEKKYIDIARYNVGDIIATRELYRYWETYLKF